MPSAVIDNSINWQFTIEWLLADCVGLAGLGLAVILWQIWRETR